MTYKPLKWLAAALVMLALLASPTVAAASDGHELWLPESQTIDRSDPQRVLLSRENATLSEARRELSAFLASPEGRRRAAAARFRLMLNAAQDPALGSDGFAIGRPRGHAITITANTPVGLLYGAFEWLRRARSGADLTRLAVQSSPRLKLRILDHWDNADGFVERGYAGRSLWQWNDLPGRIDPRYRAYARANASIGINGVVVNNVNADARFLTAPYLAKLSALAGALRPWGIRTYLSVRWDAPVTLGGLPDADPLDPRVAAWWRSKADEIYAEVPDFGGFLVKAGSEGQPGPQQYGRSHAQGANMLADALRPWGGIVMWRAFVYSQDNPDDRAKQAYTEFKPLDGQFADNVLVQVKNGPIDFQPREPVHPLFGAMPRTQLMPEFQITKEYLGQASHLAYLGPLFAETLQTDTLAHGTGSTVARIADGRLTGHRLTGIAGVANIGDDADWCGSVFNQANWYAFGRLAWDPDLTSDGIAREWAAQTFATGPADTRRIAAMMARSREAVVDYMTPMGLAHLMGTGHHYGPAPWVSDLARPEWNPVYYHRADAAGIGFDRTARGSNAAAQYAPAIAARLQDPGTTDARVLLWFHHLPWTWRTRSGAPLWAALVRRYDRGVAEVAAMQREWQSLEAAIDPQRFARTRDLLKVQRQEARWWHDAGVAYFQSINHLPLPAGSTPPEHDLAWYQAQRFTGIAGTPD